MIIKIQVRHLHLVWPAGAASSQRGHAGGLLRAGARPTGIHRCVGDWVGLCGGRYRSKSNPHSETTYTTPTKTATRPVRRQNACRREGKRWVRFSTIIDRLFFKQFIGCSHCLNFFFLQWSSRKRKQAKVAEWRETRSVDRWYILHSSMRLWAHSSSIFLLWNPLCNDWVHQKAFSEARQLWFDGCKPRRVLLRRWRARRLPEQVRTLCIPKDRNIQPSCCVNFLSLFWNS